MSTAISALQRSRSRTGPAVGDAAGATDGTRPRGSEKTSSSRDGARAGSGRRPRWFQLKQSGHVNTVHAWGTGTPRPHAPHATSRMSAAQRSHLPTTESSATASGALHLGQASFAIGIPLRS